MLLYKVKDEVFFIFSGTSLDGKSALPTIETTDHECEILHSLIQKNFQSLLESHCPKVYHSPNQNSIFLLQKLISYFYSLQKLHRNY